MKNCSPGLSSENQCIFLRLKRKSHKEQNHFVPKCSNIRGFIVQESGNLKAIWNDSSHLLHDEFQTRVIPRKGRLRTNRSVTNRYTNSFAGQAITRFNEEFVK